MSTSSSIPPDAGSSITELATTLGAQLRAPYRRLQRRLYADLARKFPEVRRAHSAVFRHIAPEGSRLTELAEQAEMTKQSMAYLVEHLAGRGYVRMERDPADGRAVRVKLTAKGRRFVAVALAASAEIEREAVARMGAENMARLRHLLAELDAGLAEAEPPAQSRRRGGSASER